MRRSIALAGALLLASLSGCITQPDRREASPPFVFRALNLREQDKQGRPAWQVTSPEARYDINRRIASAVNPAGLIYAAGQPLYRLSAQRALVINDGEVIQLEGAVSIRRLGARPVLIEAERLRWYPSRSLMELEHQPRIREGLSLVRAGQATLNLSTETVLLRNQPVFERWSSPDQHQGTTLGPDAPAGADPAALQLRASKAEWSLKTGDWEASGPIQGNRLVPGQSRPQTLSAASMHGNSKQQNLELLAPVVLLDPDRKTRIDALLTRIDLVSQRISSHEPVRATIGNLLINGGSVAVNLVQNQALIPADCRIRQPGMNLQAQQCRWNWITSEVWAQGGVTLERSASGQVTRSEALTGRLGPQGGLMVFTPGGRVQSQIQVQGTGPRSPRRPPAIVP